MKNMKNFEKFEKHILSAFIDNLYRKINFNLNLKCIIYIIDYDFAILYNFY